MDYEAKYDQETNILYSRFIGTPNSFEDDEYIHVFDRKTCNSLDWYEDKYRDMEKFPESRIWDENLQRLFY